MALSGNGSSHQALAIEKTWERFVMGAGDVSEARSVVISSWHRSKSAGINPGVITPRTQLPEHAVREEWQQLPIAQELEPWVQHMRAISADAGYLVVIAGPTGVILRVEGDHHIRGAAQQMHFVEGVSWGEHSTGTNAIGTALAAREPVQISGAEHFVQMVHPWTCTAAPICDPATGNPLAVFDLTGLREKMHPYATSLVLSVVQNVQERLKLRLQSEHFRLLEHYLSALARTRSDLLVVMDRSGAILRAAPELHEEGLIDSDGRLKGLPLPTCLEGYGTEWEAEGRHGHRTFVSQPIFQGALLMGALVHAKPLRVAPPSAGRGSTRYSFQSIVGQSPALKAVLVAAWAAASSNLPVLIEGQSGTGKELLVQAMHAASSRAAGPFVAVNCGAIPKDLVASEFFGYEGGAFTGGAKEGRLGKFQQANDGTIFLDEIGEMPLDAQVHLLRVLEESEVIRVGGYKPVKLNVRVIAATNQDLGVAIRTGAFRSDLYYRLNVVSLRVPSLKERAGDVPLLARWFLGRAAAELGRIPLSLSDAARQVLEGYDWPGNIRELRNMMYRMVLLAPGPLVEVADLPLDMTASKTVSVLTPARPGIELRPAPPTMGDQELALIQSALAAAHGNVALAAQQLGIHRSTIYRKLKEHA